MGRRLASDAWLLDGRAAKRVRMIAGLCLCCGVLSNCVDPEQTGVSTQLLVSKSLPSVLDPGMSLEIAFQAVDDNGAGVPDQALELLISDTTRLRFAAAPNTDHYVVRTGRSNDVDGTDLSGAAVIQLIVPNSAVEGTVAVIASLEGQKGANSKTQWASFSVSEAGAPSAGSGGASTEGGSAGTGVEAGAAGMSDSGGMNAIAAGAGG